MPETTKELLAETRRMSFKIDRLADHIDISKASVRRLKIITFLSTLLICGGLVSSWLIYDLYRDLGSNQVTTCQSSNERTAANKRLWTYIMDVSEHSNPDATPQQRRFFKDMRQYIDAVYVDRDCSDLSRRYVTPTPPAVPKSERKP